MQVTFRGVEVGYPRCRLLYDVPGKTLVKHIDVASLAAGEFHAANPVAVRHLLAHAGMAYLPHLFAIEDFDVVNVKALHLSPEGIRFYETYIQQGLAELRLRNGLPVAKRVRVNPHESAPRYRPHRYAPRDSALLMNGGGKDTAVAGELLRDIGLPFEWFALGATPAMKRLAQISGNPRMVTLRIGGSARVISGKTRYYGHRPFSSVLACLGLLVALVRRHRYVVTANEYSANFGNAKSGGVDINHQYPKSHEFERQFGAYLKKEILPEASYFSILRPLFEIQIAKIFAGFPQYYEVFRSCNIGHRADYWCLACPKCAFVLLALAPHLDKSQLRSIFGWKVFAVPAMRRQIARLCGPIKPFECVGTQGESMMTLWMARQRHPNDRFLESLFESCCGGIDLSALEPDYMRKIDRSHSIPAELADAATGFFENRLKPHGWKPPSAYLLRGNANSTTVGRVA
jgi:UDP-N-acetyl-alpha-D-muramoyl-L-alanyl-L-glutamate epimerase